MSAPDDPLAEALHALELPPEGVRALLDHVHRFCSRHGGRRHYAELLDLVDECNVLLEVEREAGSDPR